jgi:hypothetical protein
LLFIIPVFIDDLLKLTAQQAVRQQGLNHRQQHFKCPMNRLARPGNRMDITFAKHRDRATYTCSYRQNNPGFFR